jgi:hypothetical protein
MKDEGVNRLCYYPGLGMITYLITEDEGYGWITGITSDGRQAIAADDVNLFFDSSGRFLQMETLLEVADWKERAEKVISKRGPIHVQAFEIVGESIGIRPLPDSNMFVFLLGDDFWMNRDGTVNSH